MSQQFATKGLSGVAMTDDKKLIVRITGVDEDGVQHTILVTSDGKIMVDTVTVGTLLKQDLVLVDSTTTALGGAGTYTSTAFSLDGYRKIVGSALADQPGTLHVEQSQNGTNWDLISSFPVNTDPNARGAGFQADVLALYGRVRYVNLATAQTTFRLYTYLRVI